VETDVGDYEKSRRFVPFSIEEGARPIRNKQKTVIESGSQRAGGRRDLSFPASVSK